MPVDPDSIKCKFNKTKRTLTITVNTKYDPNDPSIYPE